MFFEYSFLGDRWCKKTSVVTTEGQRACELARTNFGFVFAAWVLRMKGVGVVGVTDGPEADLFFRCGGAELEG